jgi:serpin B
MKRISLAMACICLISLAACSSDGGGYGSINIANVSAKALISPYEEQDLKAQGIAKGANDFAFRLSAVLVKNLGNENFVCSPYSAWLPLAALANATNAQQRSALFSALGSQGVSEADINRAASRMLYDLTKMRNKETEGVKGSKYYNPLKIANAIFVENTVKLKNDFAQTFMDYYRGNAINVDFSSNDAADAVNRWARDNTEGLISKLVEKFDPETVAAIANAIYFSDKWQWEFNPGETTKGVFHSPEGNTQVSYMLREGDGQQYYEDSKVQAMPLSFNSGGGMYIILPKTGNAADFLASMTESYFSEIGKNTSAATGKLLLPRFSIENDVKDLDKALVALGVPLFDRETAPLTGGLIEENLPLYVSSAIQKALIKVDETGTTAAAVTVMAVSATGAPLPTKPFEMICDKPFVFILYEHTYDGGNQILFTGVVNKP